MSDDEDNKLSEEEPEVERRHLHAPVPSQHPPAAATSSPNNIIERFVKTYEHYHSLSILIAAISVVVILIIGADECRTCFNKLRERDEDIQVIELDDRKTYWAYGKNIESGFLKNVFGILDSLGYRNDPTGNATGDWDLLWAHDYPFRTLYPQLKNLRPHQKVNHFPGCGYVTNKVDLATSGLKYIPVAFKLPDHKAKLLDHVARNPLVKFVQKNNDHRNIKVVESLAQVDLDAEGTFLQEFVDRPLLVSGHKFDIGIYTIVTSIDPLRIYIYNGDFLLRFCPVKYYPFDPENLDKYVIGDDYLPIWQVPALDYYYNELGFGMRESLNAFLEARGKNPKLIWERIEDAIRVAVLAKEPKIVEVANKFKSTRNFFEMMRFDFVVDEDLNVYLLEANMSPNLSSAHYPPNQLLYQQVLYNLMGLLGIGERVRKDSLAVRSKAEEDMVVTDKNIATHAKECNSQLCRSSCVAPVCQLCRPCLSHDTKEYLIQAYKEHLNRGDCKRVFPPTLTKDTVNSVKFDEYSAENQLQSRWFEGKCFIDPSWC